MERGGSDDDREHDDGGERDRVASTDAEVGSSVDVAWGSAMDGDAQFVLDTYWPLLVESWNSPQPALADSVALSVVEAQAVVELLRGQAAVMHDLPGFPDRAAAMVERLADHIAGRLPAPPRPMGQS